jgi:HAD superfamily hydrolase (TIGR01509 family)
MTQALLFDLDGTLIDSMPLHARSWALWHAESGIPYEEGGFFAATAGRTNMEILRDQHPQRSEAERQAMADRKEVIYRELAGRELQLIPGALDFCRRAKAAGRRLAVCTAAPPENVAVAFARFADSGLQDLFETVTCPADPRPGGAPGETLRGKPEPDIFLEAARRMGVAPADCLVYEDAPLGIEAARRAGMRAVALTTTLGAEAFAGQAHVLAIMADFTGHALPA